jgi:hypothetical protein
MGRVERAYSTECPVRLRDALNALQNQFGTLKAEALALEAKIQCTCIQTHAATCQAVSRPVDLAAPWIGMKFWAQFIASPPIWRECQIEAIRDEENGKHIDWFRTDAGGRREYFIPNEWDKLVRVGSIKAEKP